MVAAVILSIICACGDAGQPSSAEAPDSLFSGPLFNEHIRSTEARTPEDERKGFKLPEGFEISLYASEPDIGKPINIAFDAKGRVWVTQSFEYPFPATPGEGKDRLTMLEDTDNDGRADKFTHFTDTLNIPIGLLPVQDGAVVYSIPNVYRYVDANNDGKPESKKKLFGPFETKDTHGMVNNFATGFDGWIHACHGYTNRSTVAGADGDSIHMVSGNTFRFRPDGSRVEHETDGRINPFGLVYDELGYLYSTDCHTSPLYQLIRGGDYTQWGKEEGMGFAPDMKPLENEATALAGIAYYADNKYPKDFQQNFYIGDVVSSRVYRNSMTWKGSSPVGKREEDFVMSQDPWFRPVDVKMGPDGAIYIADFYNSIIGHYEVPLDHPKRDRIRGRIWKITYKGETNAKRDLTNASVQALLEAFKASNLPLRLMAADQLVTRIGAQALQPARALMQKSDVSPQEYIHSLWVVQRLGGLDESLIKSSLANGDPMIRVHTLRAMREQGDTVSSLYPLITRALEDKDPHVRRAAAELMGRYPDMASVETLIGFRKKTAADDSHMIYTTRLMLRNLLRREELMNSVAAREWSKEDAEVISTVLAGVETPASGVFLFNYVKKYGVDKGELPKAFRHIVRFVPQAQVNEAVAVARQKVANDDEAEYKVFRSLQEGLLRRGADESPAFTNWGKEIAASILAQGTNVKKNSDTEQEKIDQLQFGLTLAGNYEVKALSPQLTALAADTAVRDHIRTAALRSLMQIDPVKNASVAATMLQGNASSPELKRNVVGVLAEFPGDAVNRALASVGNAPPDLQQGIVMALAGSASGRNLLFEKVKKGEIFARTLAEPKVEERLMMNISTAHKRMYEELTAGLEEIDKEKQAVISGRIADFNNLREKPSVEKGKTVFVRNCSPCHSIKGEGGAIGPQLDGVGKWGVAPLMEKILDPNRNVSENFRNYTLTMKDGKVMSGLYRRDEGEVMVFANVSGQEFSVPKNQIAERKPSKYTLMPDQFRNSITPEDFNALIAFLLAQKNS